MMAAMRFSTYRSLGLIALTAGAGCAKPAFSIEDETAFFQVVPPEARLERVATGFAFTEGPAWFDRDGGYLVFSDMTANRLMRWSERDGVTVFRDRSPEPNGNASDANGRLITCEHESRRVSRTEIDGRVTPLVERFEGKRLNSPNDVVVKSDGSIWFTDPIFGLRGRAPELEGNNVFRFDPETRELRVVVGDGRRPNGLCFSPDERRLYVTECIRPSSVRVFDVGEEGEVRDGRTFYEVDAGFADGIRTDADGRVFVAAGDGVHVADATGRLLGRILVPESVSNVEFGGADQSVLFITAGRSLYRIGLCAKGG